VIPLRDQNPTKKTPLVNRLLIVAIERDSNTVRNDDFSANGCDTDYGAPPAAPPGGRTLSHGAGFDCSEKDNGTNYSPGFPHPANNSGSNSNADSDADGLINVLDCNDGSSSFLWPATEVQSEQITGKPLSTISWDAQASFAGSGVTYDVVRGSLSQLNGFADAVCHAPNLIGTTATDSTVPGAGTGLYFLERAGTGNAECVGTYGAGTTAGRDAFLTAICP